MILMCNNCKENNICPFCDMESDECVYDMLAQCAITTKNEKTVDK